MGYRELRGLQGVKGGYKGLQGVTGGGKRLEGVTKDYRNFLLTRTFPDTFSCSILHDMGIQGLTRGFRGLQGVTRADRG